MNVLKNYLELTKPKVVLMMLITAIVGMLLASKTLPSIYLTKYSIRLTCSSKSIVADSPVVPTATMAEIELSIW